MEVDQANAFAKTGHDILNCIVSLKMLVIVAIIGFAIDGDCNWRWFMDKH